MSRVALGVSGAAGVALALAVECEPGAIVLPPVPAFYLKPDSIEQVIAQIAARSVDLLRIAPPIAHGWTGADASP